VSSPNYTDVDRTQRAQHTRVTPETDSLPPEQIGESHIPPTLAQRMMRAPQRMTQRDILYLQRTMGNRSVAQILRRSGTKVGHTPQIQRTPDVQLKRLTGDQQKVKDVTRNLVDALANPQGNRVKMSLEVGQQSAEQVTSYRTRMALLYFLGSIKRLQSDGLRKTVESVSGNYGWFTRNALLNLRSHAEKAGKNKSDPKRNIEGNQKKYQRGLGGAKRWGKIASVKVWGPLKATQEFDDVKTRYEDLVALVGKSSLNGLTPRSILSFYAVAAAAKLSTHDNDQLSGIESNRRSFWNKFSGKSEKLKTHFKQLENNQNETPSNSNEVESNEEQLEDFGEDFEIRNDK
jgi:hypothetical protein